MVFLYVVHHLVAWDVRFITPAWNDVLWAIGTRSRPDRDVMLIPGVPSFSRDPHRTHWGRVGIDATKPLEHLADFERKKTPMLDTLNLDDYFTPPAARP